MLEQRGDTVRWQRLARRPRAERGAPVDPVRSRRKARLVRPHGSHLQRGRRRERWRDDQLPDRCRQHRPAQLPSRTTSSARTTSTRSCAASTSVASTCGCPAVRAVPAGSQSQGLTLFARRGQRAAGPQADLPADGVHCATRSTTATSSCSSSRSRRCRQQLVEGDVEGAGVVSLRSDRRRSGSRPRRGSSTGNSATEHREHRREPSRRALELIERLWRCPQWCPPSGHARRRSGSVPSSSARSRVLCTLASHVSQRVIGCGRLK